jgi:hypothetical protein
MPLFPPRTGHTLRRNVTFFNKEYSTVSARAPRGSDCARPCDRLAAHRFDRPGHWAPVQHSKICSQDSLKTASKILSASAT